VLSQYPDHQTRTSHPSLQITLSAHRALFPPRFELRFGRNHGDKGLANGGVAGPQKRPLTPSVPRQIILLWTALVKNRDALAEKLLREFERAYPDNAAIHKLGICQIDGLPRPLVSLTSFSKSPIAAPIRRVETNDIPVQVRRNCIPPRRTESPIPPRGALFRRCGVHRLAKT